ncbi:MAG: hypothetical protein Q8N98_03280, partial [bacterium]|nr:hypothetical protein [bacterium]
NIEGVFYLSREKQGDITGSAAPLAQDINIFPSPYLNGHLDKFLDSDLMPILQTARGCPFQVRLSGETIKALR